MHTDNISAGFEFQNLCSSVLPTHNNSLPDKKIAHAKAQSRKGIQVVSLLGAFAPLREIIFGGGQRASLCSSVVPFFRELS
jgi:hypothetical protein